jgi:hypothetical protein
VSSTVDLDEATQLGPWWYRFEVSGQTFGGDIPRDTDRVETFFRWLESFGDTIATVLELGSHEGSHSLQLAEHPGVTRVLGLEGREDNVERARFVQRVYGADSIEFRHYNLEDLDPSEVGPFDAVFCAGLLYHLPRPWRLIEQLAPITRWLFLDTHYSATDGQVLAFPYRGCWQHEGPDPLSGLSSFSFWLSFRQLVLVLLESGFALRFVRDLESDSGPRTWLLAEQQGFSDQEISDSARGVFVRISDKEHRLILRKRKVLNSFRKPTPDNGSPRREQ